MIECCKQCGIKLFEDSGCTSSKPLIQFRSFAIRKDNEGNPYYLCIDCHEGKNKEMFEKNLSEN